MEKLKSIKTMGAGQLLEFTPTESNGTSPALKKLVQQIHASFLYKQVSQREEQIALWD
jgi:hypothetical protein